MSEKPIRDFEVALAPKVGMIGRLFGRGKDPYFLGTSDWSWPERAWTALRRNCVEAPMHGGRVG